MADAQAQLRTLADRFDPSAFDAPSPGCARPDRGFAAVVLGGGELARDSQTDQNQTPWTPSRTAPTEINRPIPENRAIETNWFESDFLAESVVDAEIGVETRIAVGMSGSPII